MPNKPLRLSKFKQKLISWAILVIIGLGYSAYDTLYDYPASPGPGIGQSLLVEIPSGVGPEALSKILEEKGIIKGVGRFIFWLRVTSGLKTVKTGTFELLDNMTPQQVLNVISGKSVTKGTRVTIPEGFTLRRIGEALEKTGIISIDDFFAASHSKKLLKELEIPGESAEGFLFPDTYFFEKGAGAEEIVRRMHKNFLLQLAPLGQPDNTDLKKLVTLASIVQAEAKIMEEAKIIAGVYTNRLNPKIFSSGLLQADPTVSYGCEAGVTPHAPSCPGFTGKLTRRQLDDSQNPYNTYKHPGLPPGPICAPGIHALKAAMAPKKVPYLYFVAGPNGGHRFSTTLAEHNKAVLMYRQGR